MHTFGSSSPRDDFGHCFDTNITTCPIKGAALSRAYTHFLGSKKAVKLINCTQEPSKLKGEAETRTPHFAHAAVHATDGMREFLDDV